MLYKFNQTRFLDDFFYTWRNLSFHRNLNYCILGNGDDLDLTVVLPILVFRIPGMLEVANAA